MAAPDHRLSQLLDIARLIAREPDTTRLVERILLTAKEGTRADGGSVYLVEEDGQSLAFALLVNDTLGIRGGGTSGAPLDLKPPPLFEPDGTPNHRSVVAHCVHSRQPVRLDDAYLAEGFDFAGARAFDAAHHYRSRSFLTVPMIDHTGQVIGVLQLVNARAGDGSPGTFAAEDEVFTDALTALAAIALEKQRLIDHLQVLFEALVRLVNDAIDEKSAYTGGHCRRVPELARRLAEAAHRTERGPLADFRMDDAGRRELYLAAMLHDCGKITTPVHVVDKTTKLSGLFDRIALIEARFEVAERELALARLEAIASGEPETAADAHYRAERAALASDLEFLREANRGLKRSEMSLPARIIAIADVFEALTAGDRPYKRAKSVSEALTMLGEMKLSGHVDPDLFDVFVRERVWEEYAREFLDPAQIDEVDPARIPGFEA